MFLALKLPIFEKSVSISSFATCTYLKYIHIKPTYRMPLSDRAARSTLWCGRFTQAATNPFWQFLFQVIGDSPKESVMLCS